MEYIAKEYEYSVQLTNGVYDGDVTVKGDDYRVGQSGELTIYLGNRTVITYAAGTWRNIKS